MLRCSGAVRETHIHLAGCDSRMCAELGVEGRNAGRPAGPKTCVVESMKKPRAGCAEVGGGLGCLGDALSVKATACNPAADAQATLRF